MASPMKYPAGVKQLIDFRWGGRHTSTPGDTARCYPNAYWPTRLFENSRETNVVTHKLSVQQTKKCIQTHSILGCNYHPI